MRVFSVQVAYLVFSKKATTQSKCCKALSKSAVMGGSCLRKGKLGPGISALRLAIEESSWSSLPAVEASSLSSGHEAAP